MTALQSRKTMICTSRQNKKCNALHKRKNNTEKNRLGAHTHCADLSPKYRTWSYRFQVRIRRRRSDTENAASPKQFAKQLGCAKVMNLFVNCSIL